MSRPVAGDFGAQGDFDRQARSGRRELRISKHKHWIFAAGALAVAAARLKGR